MTAASAAATAPAPLGARTMALALAGSVAVHAALAALAARVEVGTMPAREAPVEVAFEVVTAPPPGGSAPAPIAPNEPPEVRPVATRMAPPAAAHPPAPLPEPPLPLPPSSEPPPPGTPPARAAPRVGITLSSTAAAGSYAMGVGNTLYGKASEVAGDPTQARPYAAPLAAGPRMAAGPRPSAQPRLLQAPDVPYPAAARHSGLEGRVVLLLSIGEDGRVTAARVLSDPGSGLGEAAREAALHFRFSPALDAGEPVPTEIRFTYTFVLE